VIYEYSIKETNFSFENSSLVVYTHILHTLLEDYDWYRREQVYKKRWDCTTMEVKPLTVKMILESLEYARDRAYADFGRIRTVVGYKHIPRSTH